MTRKYITDEQVKLYMKYRVTHNLTQEVSAAKAGMSTRSAYTIEHGSHHTQRPKKPRDYKTRQSPLDEIWNTELVRMLENNPDLQPKTLLIYLQRTYTNEQGEPVYNDSVLRTLQRRVSSWQAQHGKPKEIIFPQSPVAGEQGQSDFTRMTDCEIIINGDIFHHMLYQFRLVYSKWSYIKIIQGGESFQALSEGLQEALFHLGGAPQEHRTDSLAAAYKNLTEDARKDLTERYEAFCANYGMEPTRNNKGKSHENGSVESSHGHLKNRIKQELLLRGNNRFHSIEDYAAWLQDIVLNHNKRHSKNFAIEKKALQSLPHHKSMDYEQSSVSVSKLSVIVVKNMTYSVPSRLAGHTLTLHIYQHHIIAYLGGTEVLSMTRKYRTQQNTRYVIDYRHIIHALIKKPRAFRHCQYRDEILPSDAYKKIGCHLDASESKDVAPKIMLRLLKLAADFNCEYELSQYVLKLIEDKSIINIQNIESQFNGGHAALPQVECKQHSLTHYDQYIP